MTRSKGKSSILQIKNFYTWVASIASIFCVSSLQTQKKKKKNLEGYSSNDQERWLLVSQGPQNSAPSISLGEKWQRAVLKIKISCCQWEGWACIHELSSCFPLVSMCSHQVLKAFSSSQMCSAKMFPIARGFYLIWFAQSWTPMYINWKGEIQGSTFCFYFAAGAH
jgi:hypothetical protein